jgi:hypothetical protein
MFAAFPIKIEKEKRAARKPPRIRSRSQSGVICIGSGT